MFLTICTCHVFCHVSSSRTGLAVGVERMDARRHVADNGTIVSDARGTDVWFYAIDPRTDTILSRRSRQLDR